MTKKIPGRIRGPFCLPSSGGNGNSAEPGDKCGVEQNPKKSRLEKIATEKISFCHDAWMYFSLQVSQVWPRCYKKYLRLRDANLQITHVLITHAHRAKQKL